MGACAKMAFLPDPPKKRGPWMAHPMAVMAMCANKEDAASVSPMRIAHRVHPRTAASIIPT